jgi:hypothetical protein
MAETLVQGGHVQMSVDLNDANLTELNTIDVQDVDRVSIYGTAATWTTAVVEVKRAVSSRRDATVSDGGFVSLEPAVTFTGSDTSSFDIDVSSAGAITLDVTTAEGGASAASFDAYGFRVERAPSRPWANYRLANGSTTNLNQTSWTQVDLDTVDYEDSEYYSLNVTSGEWTFHKAGYYEMYACNSFADAVVNGSVRSSFFKTAGGVGTYSHSAGAYIRAASNHNEATTTMRYRQLVAAGDTYGLWGIRAAAAGTINPWAYTYVILTKI